MGVCVGKSKQLIEEEINCEMYTLPDPRRPNKFHIDQMITVPFYENKNINQDRINLEVQQFNINHRQLKEQLIMQCCQIKYKEQEQYHHKYIKSDQNGLLNEANRYHLILNMELQQDSQTNLSKKYQYLYKTQFFDEKKQFSNVFEWNKLFNLHRVGRHTDAKILLLELGERQWYEELFNIEQESTKNQSSGQKEIHELQFQFQQFVTAVVEQGLKHQIPQVRRRLSSQLLMNSRINLFEVINNENEQNYASRGDWNEGFIWKGVYFKKLCGQEEKKQFKSEYKALKYLNMDYLNATNSFYHNHRMVHISMPLLQLVEYGSVLYYGSAVLQDSVDGLEQSGVLHMYQTINPFFLIQRIGQLYEFHRCLFLFDLNQLLSNSVTIQQETQFYPI